MVKLRLKRFGRHKRPFYRICAMDQRSARDSRAIEELGYFNPLESELEKSLHLKTDRIMDWLSKGAQPSDTVRDLLRKAGINAVPGKPTTIEN